MGILGSKQRCLEILAYKYHLKNKNRTSKENWKLAERFIRKIENRMAVKKLINLRTVTLIVFVLLILLRIL